MFKGNLLSFLMLAGGVFLVYYLGEKAKKGWRFELRSLPAYEAIAEGIGRAAERGEKIHFTCSTVSVTTKDGLTTLAAMGTAVEIARLAAVYDVPLVISVPSAEHLVILQELVETGYRSEGMESKADFRFLAGGYTAGILGTLQRENIGINILLGWFMLDALLLAEAGAIKGIFQVAGTGSQWQLPFFIACCDYVLIGEEVYAAAALASRDPVLMSTVFIHDIYKFLGLALMVIGVGLVSLGYPLIKSLIVW